MNTKITAEQLKKIESLTPPFHSDTDVYNRLIHEKIIKFSTRTFRQIMSNYKKSLHVENKDIKEDNNNLHKFAYTVIYLQMNTISVLKKRAYDNALDDPKYCLDYLKYYDRREKKFNEKIKKQDDIKVDMSGNINITVIPLKDK